MVSNRNSVVARKRTRLTPRSRFFLLLGASIPLLFLGIFFAWPVANMVRLGFFGDGTDPGAYFLHAWEVFERPRTLRVIGQSLLQAGVATVASTVLGFPLAYALYRLRFRGVQFLRALVIVPFVLPTVVVGLAFRSLFQRNGLLGFLDLDSTFLAVVAALVFFNISVVVRTVGVAWQNLDPRMEEAAATLGAHPFRVFLTVTVPRLFPAIISAVSIVFLFCATAFGVVLTMGGLSYGTIESEIYLLTVQFLDLSGASVLSIVQFVVVVVLLLVATKARKKRERAQREVSSFSAMRKPKVQDLPLLVLATLVGIGLALPLINLLVRSLNGSEGFTLDYYLRLGVVEPGIGVSIWQALWNSIETAAYASLLALFIGVIASLTLHRLQYRHPRLGEWLDNFIMLPLGISSVTVGLGFLITLNHPPFDLRTSPILVPIAQALVALPLVIRIILPVLTRINDKLRQSAEVLGASPLRVLVDIDLKLAIRPITAAGVFAFAISLGEFGATVFLARPDRPTMPVIIYRLMGRPGPESFGMAIAASIVLVITTVLVAALVERIQKGASGVF